MDKKNLLSIGELSKITSVHIKALRYYDSLGILTPTFVDPNSGYRYYAFEQKAVVDAIQFCVELDIPLKQFHRFISETEPWLCYADLVKHGTDIVKEKIKVMLERLAQLKIMQAEIERSEISYRSPLPKEYSLPAHDCWVIPYEGRQMCREFCQLTKKLIFEIHQKGLPLGNIGGILLLRKNGQWKEFLFVDVHISQKERKKFPEILHIPKSRYLCKKVDYSDISQVWDWCLPLVEEKNIQLVIETELFIGNYDFSAPVLEQRCLLRELDSEGSDL